MDVSYPSFGNLVAKIQPLFGTGYVRIGDIEIIVYENESFIILTGPLLRDDDFKRQYSHIEFFASLPNHGEFFHAAAWGNNLRILKQLYDEGFVPSIDKTSFTPEKGNEEAIQFIIDHWPAFFADVFRWNVDARLSGNSVYDSYYINNRGIRADDYINSQWLDYDKMTMEMLTWLDQFNVNDFDEEIEDGFGDGTWNGRVIPTSETLAYILKKTNRYGLGNDLRYHFYHYASDGEEEKWYDYIDDILNAKGIPADYSELVRLYLVNGRPGFLKFIRGKGYVIGEYLDRSLDLSPELEDLIQQGGIIDIRNIGGYRNGNGGMGWPQNSNIEKLSKVIYPIIKDKPYLIRRLMKFTPPKVLKLLDANIVKQTLFYFHLLRV